MTNLNWTDRKKLNATGVSSLQETAGVYRLIYLDPRNGNYYVFHVGQAENLKDALARHLPWREKSPELAFYLTNYRCFFRAAGIQKQAERNMTEVALYKYFLPQYMRAISAYR